jgi:hypothetical protein
LLAIQYWHWENRKLFWKHTEGPSSHEIEGERMKRTLSLLLFIFLLEACAITYTHPTKSTNDFERDKQECELIAKKALAVKGVT